MQGLLGRDPMSQPRSLLMRQRKRLSILMPPGLNGVTRVNTWVSTAPNGTVGNNTSYLAQISGNGEQIAFASMASNLPRHNDTNKTLDVYVWTRTR